VIAAADISTELIDVTVDTEYPWHGRIKITVNRAVPEPITLRIRRPSWSAGVPVTLDGTRLSATEDGGFLTWKRSWRPGEELSFDLELPVTAVAGHSYLDAVRDTVAITRGPLVYCLEHLDTDFEIDDVLLDPAAVGHHVLGSGRDDGAAADPITGNGVELEIQRAVAPPDELYPVIASSAEPVEAPMSVPSAPTETSSATFIPYFLWGNREPGPMRVWLRRAMAEPNRR